VQVGLGGRLETILASLEWPKQFQASKPTKIFGKRDSSIGPLRDHQGFHCAVCLGTASTSAASLQDCSEILRNLDHLSALHRGGTCAPIDLHAVIKDYLDSFVAVNGDEFWVPKCHITLHLNEFLRHHGTLLSCFAHDRKQRFVKRFGNPVNNVIQSFEKSILSDIIHAQVREFGEEAVGLGLSLFKDKKVAKGKMDWRSDMLGSSDCFTSIRAQGPGGHLVQKDDVVEYLEGDGPPSVGQVMYHVRHGSTLLNVLCPWDRVHDTMFKVKHDPAVILLSYVVQCLDMSCPCSRALLAL